MTETYYINPRDGDNRKNDGRTAETAFKTFGKAIAAANAARTAARFIVVCKGETRAGVEG